MLTLVVGVSWTEAVADCVVSATLVAVIVMVCAPLMAEGAVYKPFDKLPTEGVMDQVTVALAVNWVVCEGPKLTLDGLTDNGLPAGVLMEDPAAMTARSEATPWSVATSLPDASR